jgi:SAM-dependent methyltransferase
MSFYQRFARHYEQVFPYRPATLDFLAARLPRQGRVLDLGCGTGHYAGALAARGLEAVGLDLDTAMIRAARERYGAAHFAVGDLTEIKELTDHADGAFCIGNVLPHLPPGALERFLGDLVAVLAPGAPWIVQTVNFDRLLPLRRAHDFPPLAVDDGLVFRRRYEPRPGAAVAFRTALARADELLFEGEATLWPLTSGELAARHRAVGLELMEEAGGFKGEVFAPDDAGGCVQVYRRTAGG